jgi:predicted DNA-binding protein
MARNKTKNSDAVSFRIRKDISERLSSYSESSRIPKTAIVEMALEEYLSKVAPIKKNNK